VTLRSLPLFTEADNSFVFTAMPWFSAPLTDAGDIYLSGGLSGEYADEQGKAIPELYRFEIRYRFTPNLRLGVGRLIFREPINLIFNGLADGASVNYDLGRTRLSAGAFYTGLQYKKAAYITMTADDYAEYLDRDTYFASRRVVLSLGWEAPGFLNTPGSLSLGILGQFDLNSADVKIHSQYALAAFSLPFLKRFNADLGAAAGLIEEEGDLGLCFAASAYLVWFPQAAANTRLTLGGSFSSGRWNDTVKAFLPISSIAQGKVLRPKISGLALVEGTCTVSFHRALSAEFSGAYFFRTDTVTYSDSELDPASLSPLIGPEAAVGLTWVPVSDLSFTLGAGLFFPQLGKSFMPGAALKRRISIGTIFSF
jgi:hypothetical protein